MKPSTESWSDANTDALLFEYLEGELSEERAKELEERLASDPGLQMELEHWKEAFVEQEFYDTRLLEERLLKPPVKVGHSATSAGGFMVTFFISMFSFLTLAPEKETLRPARMIEMLMPVVTVGKKEIVRKSPKSAQIKKLLHQVSSHNSPAEEVMPPRALFEKVNEEELLQPKLLPLADIQPEFDLSILEGRMNRIGLKKASAVRIITRKQQRKIERMKEKAWQERKANQFLKGRIPYVVPLNTNNF